MEGHWNTEAAEVPLLILESFVWQVLSQVWVCAVEQEWPFLASGGFVLGIAGAVMSLAAGGTSCLAPFASVSPCADFSREKNHSIHTRGAVPPQGREICICSIPERGSSHLSAEKKHL